MCTESLLKNSTNYGKADNYLSDFVFFASTNSTSTIIRAEKLFSKHKESPKPFRNLSYIKKRFKKSLALPEHDVKFLITQGNDKGNSVIPAGD